MVSLAHILIVLRRTPREESVCAHVFCFRFLHDPAFLTPMGKGLAPKNLNSINFASHPRCTEEGDMIVPEG